MTRVIHTGDTHLGYRQYHSPERRADFLAAFRSVVEDAIADDVDAVVHAGDLFHDRSPALADVYGAIQVLRELEDADIPFLAVVGNHERTREGQWLDLFQTLGLATRLGDEPVTVGDDGDSVAIYGLDFVPRSARDDLDFDFAPHDAEFAALVAHGLFTPFNAEWSSKEVLSTAPVDFDAMLLGDDHQPDTARVEGTWVTYCGSTERTSAAEREERGYNIVEFDAEGGDATAGAAGTDVPDEAAAADPTDPEPGGGVSIRRRGIETRPFVTIDVELSDGEGPERLRERVREEAIEDAVVVVSVAGAGEEVQPARIEEFARERGALIARVRDRREIQTEEAIEAVSFADPDDAVRERVRELGLSEAALTIDETVRSDVADSNVRDRIRERVEEMLDEPGAFELGAPPNDVDEGDAVTEDEPGGEDAGAGSGDDAVDQESPEPEDAPSSTAAVTDVDTAPGTETAVEEPASPAVDETEAATVVVADESSAEEATDDSRVEDPMDQSRVEVATDDAGETTDDAGETADEADEADDELEASESTADRNGDDEGGDGQLSMEDYL